MNVSMETGKLERGFDEEARVTAAFPLDWNVPRSSRLKGLLLMMLGVARRMGSQKGLALWSFLRYSVAGIYFWIGGSFFFGSRRISIDPAFRLLENIEPGGIRGHGLILLVLAFTIASKPVWHSMTKLALTATLFYSLLTASLMIGGWIVHRPDVTSPAWYVFVAGLSFALIVTAPPAKRALVRSRDGGASA